MKTAQLLRIALALAIIFTAGVFTGRWTNSQRAPVQIAAAGGKTMTTENVVAHLTAELGLDPAQRAKVRVIVEEFAEPMSTLPPASPQRREIFRKCLPRIREILRPDQNKAMDRYVEMAERRWNRIIRRREAMEGTAGLPTPAPTGTNTSK